MIEDLVTSWEHPGKEALLLIWVQSSDSSFVTSEDQEIRYRNCWFLFWTICSWFGCLTTDEVTSANSDAVIKNTCFHTMCQSCFVGWERQNENMTCSWQPCFKFLSMWGKIRSLMWARAAWSPQDNLSSLAPGPGSFFSWELLGTPDELI